MPEATEPIAVNTGPLIALESCGQLALLQKLHSVVVAPEAVLGELRRGRAAGPGPVLPPPTWLDVRPLRAPPIPLLAEYLDPGEAAVIALAIEEEISLVAIDERRGRMVARTLGLHVTGSVGVLLRAKRRGLVTSIRPCLDAMRQHGIWIGEGLRLQALRDAGEA